MMMNEFWRNIIETLLKSHYVLCAWLVNLQYIFRKTFPKNPSGGMPHFIC